jgi:hypothetical protein
MLDEVQDGIKNSVELFDEAVSRTSNLAIVCAEEVDGKDILIVENSDISKDIEGHQCTVDVTEIFAVVKDCKSAQEFIDVITGARGAIVCQGVTRIVGYYSRTHNWNKSKIGELRDRQKGTYGQQGYKTEHQKEALKAVNALS